MKKLKARLTAYKARLNNRHTIKADNAAPHSPYHWLILPKGGEPVPTQGTQSNILTIGWSK